MKIILTLILLLSLVLISGCKQSIEILEVNQADSSSVLDLVNEQGEEIPNPS